MIYVMYTVCEYVCKELLLYVLLIFPVIILISSSPVIGTAYCRNLYTGCIFVAAHCRKLSTGCIFVAAYCRKLSTGCIFVAAYCRKLSTGCIFVAAYCRKLSKGLTILFADLGEIYKILHF